LIKKIEELQDLLEIPKTIKEALGAEVTEKEFLDCLDSMSRDAFDDQCTGANPRYPLVKEIKEMYLRAYYGK
jgi:acetaldehyde dehydrogenase/alcohol dehydrogenase